jgi:antitoxin component YwqK of YwqJK toxin-antitoxin module
MSESLAKPRKKTIKNQEDEQGRRHGHWECFWADGVQVYYKGSYSHGNMHGLWEKYQYNGKMAWKGEFKNNRVHGLWYEKKFN